jgi:hypothetical protein
MEPLDHYIQDTVVVRTLKEVMEDPINPNSWIDWAVK